MERKMREIERHFKEHRLTPQRKMILQIFLEHREKHLSAEEVFQFSREKGAEIGLATIYRTLDLLEELGLLHKMHFGDGRNRYEIQRGVGLEDHHHHHLVCVHCYEIFEVEEDLLHQLEETIEQQYRFHIINHNLHFYGYCSRCQALEKKWPGGANARPESGEEGGDDPH